MISKMKVMGKLARKSLSILGITDASDAFDIPMRSNDSRKRGFTYSKDRGITAEWVSDGEYMTVRTISSNGLLSVDDVKRLSELADKSDDIKIFGVRFKPKSDVLIELTEELCSAMEMTEEAEEVAKQE